MIKNKKNKFQLIFLLKKMFLGLTFLSGGPSTKISCGPVFDLHVFDRV